MFSGGRQPKLYTARGPCALSPPSLSLHRVALSIVQKDLETPTNYCISMQLGARRWHRPINTRLSRSTLSESVLRPMCTTSEQIRIKLDSNQACIVQQKGHLKLSTQYCFLGAFFLHDLMYVNGCELQSLVRVVLNAPSVVTHSRGEERAELHGEALDLSPF